MALPCMYVSLTILPPPPPLQEHPLALGIDSGCVYGGQLTACVFHVPEVAPERAPEYSLVSVNAALVYEVPKSRGDG